MIMNKRLLTLFAIVVGIALISVNSASVQAATSFTFGAAGDFANGTPFHNTAAKVKLNNPAFLLGLGDLAYTTQEQSWCTYWKTTVGYNNIEIISGNHDSGESSSGNINTYTTYCPYTLTSPITGTYGKQYYFDYPATNPIARFIAISAGLGGSFIGFDTNYAVGSQGYNFTSSAIDDARARGIKWVVVGMHKNCLTMATKSCSDGSNLEPITELFINKKVDLVIQGHDHTYQRSKQIAFNGGTCTTSTFRPNAYVSGCVVNDGSTGTYTKDAGTIFNILGMGGQGLYNINTADSEAPYFVKYMGGNYQPTFGYNLFTVTDTQLSAQFIASNTGVFLDNFTINAGGTPPPPPPPADTTPPSQPTGLTATAASSTQINLSWTASTDNVGVTGYKVYRNGSATPVGTPTTNSFNDTGLTPSTTYSYYVVANDAAGNSSPNSSTVSATTQAPACPVLPTDKGTATLVVNITAAGTYKVWSRIKGGGDTSNSYYLQIDNNCGVNVGDLAGMAANTWTWVDYQDGSATAKTSVNLTVGSHILKLIGREIGLKLDRVILTTDTICVPVGTGDSCASTTRTGDLNGDGFVNIFDASILFFNWDSKTTPAYDLNHNGTIDIFDASILFFNWTG